MIDEVIMYGMSCDGCDEPLGNDDFYALVMPTKTDIIDEARNQEWREIDGEWYCPICVERLFNYDEDNDVYTRKESI